MYKGFPTGRNLRSDEILVKISHETRTVSLIWCDQGRRREFPRLIWHAVAFTFIGVGLFGIDDFFARVFFVVIGIVSVLFLQSRIQLILSYPGVLKRNMTLFGFELSSESLAFPKNSSFRVRRIKETDGSAYYLQLSGENCTLDLLPVEGWDNYDRLCETLSVAFEEIYESSSQNKR